jgi:MscS family membrane protein
MGIGGLAIALAAKDTVGNVFGSLAILFDRPFEIGDWVTIGDVDGTVEKVGIRSTRIRTFYNSLITVPNSVIINATIDNYGQRRFRRIRIFLGITYDTPPDKIEAFCEGIREVIRQHPYTRKDYYHVYLNNFSESSLDILLYCFQECPDWSTELRERQRLFLDILRLAKHLGVEFAFPTQTLFMNPEKGDATSSGNGLDTDEALALGQKAGRAVVEEGMGKNPTLPPPVSFAPVRQKPTDGFDDSEEE